MRLDESGVLTALSALAEQWEALAPPEATLSLVVCGGSALQALGLIAGRTTRDVDVLAIATIATPTGEEGEEAGSIAAPSLTPATSLPTLLLTAEPLPPLLLKAAALVARDFGLPADWLNAGPTDLLTEGLPAGFSGRLHARRFGQGERLTVLFADRIDQICFKSYAALNGGGARHLTDLRALRPTDDEMLFAVHWILTQDAADFFPELVRDYLRKVGYANVADRF